MTTSMVEAVALGKIKARIKALGFGHITVSEQDLKELVDAWVECYMSPRNTMSLDELTEDLVGVSTLTKSGAPCLVFNI